MCIGADVEMGKSNQRYVAKSEKNLGWRVWDRKMECWWGEWRGHLQFWFWRCVGLGPPITEG